MVIETIDIVFYVIGLISAVSALWRARTTQGATAWVVGLVGFPKVMVPLFLVFGRNRFYGYVRERKKLDKKARAEMGEISQFENRQVTPPGELGSLKPIAKLAHEAGFMAGNQIELLVNADATFASIFEAIAHAQDYILFQFYIIRDDAIGTQFADRLIEKAREGVRVYFLYDAVGTTLHRKYLKRLRAAGIRTSRFSSTHFSTLKIQMNFRNHRKNVVVDGQIAFVGGINVGDDYLGRYSNVGPWRDTHCRVEGPAALSAQVSFLKDWNWSEEEILDLKWETKDHPENAHVMVLHTGPADEVEAALLSYLTLVNSARERIWIANPYIVPPEAIADALALAALRGIDVRILMPANPDKPVLFWAAEVYAAKLLKHGVKIFRYRTGFMHQKVLLIDDVVASVGSTNLDPRSMFINFEIMAISPHKPFVQSVARMLEADLANADVLKLEHLENRPVALRLRARAASLLSPVL